MRADEVRDLSRLAGLAASGGARRVQEVHDGIARRAFRPLGAVATPVRRTHDAVAGAVYASVAVGLRTGARAAGAAGALAASGRPLDGTPRAGVALAVLNGAHGDLVAREAPSLALDMTVRVAGRDVPVDRAALAAGFPGASGSVAVFLHGLTENEGAWCFRAVRHHGDRSTTYGSMLQRDLGLTPVYLRYSTGLRIGDNGARLDALLARLVEQWPVPVQDVVLVGHSMGGLVARSALHQARGGTPDAAPWTRLVRDTVTLGTPHLGAPLERGVHALAGALARVPETRPVATLLDTRSAGIRDLRRGTLVADDEPRSGTTPGRRHTWVPLHDGARHFVVLATVPRDPDGRLAHVVGDLLVPPRSACGDTGGDDRLAFPADHVHRLGGLHHFDLLNHPLVYAQLRRWLVDRPEGPRPDAPPG